MDDMRVTDRDAVEFDHQSPEYAKYWTDQYRALRKEHPVAWSKNHGGYWVITRHADLMRCARDWETFSSEKIWDPATGVGTKGKTIPPTPMPVQIPIELDPPVWNKFRSILAPYFGPRSLEARRKTAQALAVTLVNRFIESGKSDFVADLANPLPALMTMDLLGVPFENWKQWSDPCHDMAAVPKSAPEFSHVVASMSWLRDRVGEEIAKCQKTPRPGLLSHIANSEIDGRRVTLEEARETGVLVLLGGVDTTTALTSNVLIYLDKNRDARQRLIDDPALFPVATEEFVRFYTPVHTMPRHVTKDVEVGGQTLRAGDPVLLGYSSANRDETVFERPDEIILDRLPNPHVGWGGGIHRCVGSFLARIMFEVMVKEVLARIPDYKIDHAKTRQYTSCSSINGWATVPASFTPGKKIDGGFPLPEGA